MLRVTCLKLAQKRIFCTNDDAREKLRKLIHRCSLIGWIRKTTFQSSEMKWERTRLVPLKGSFFAVFRHLSVFCDFDREGKLFLKNQSHRWIQRTLFYRNTCKEKKSGHLLEVCIGPTLSEVVHQCWAMRIKIRIIEIAYLSVSLIEVAQSTEEPSRWEVNCHHVRTDNVRCYWIQVRGTKLCKIVDLLSHPERFRRPLRVKDSLIEAASWKLKIVIECRSFSNAWCTLSYPLLNFYSVLHPPQNDGFRLEASFTQETWFGSSFAA